MGFLDTYRRMMNIQGGSLNGSQKEALKQRIISGFYDSPSYCQVYINNSPIPSDVWITDESDTKELKRLTTKPDTGILNVGDIVEWNDSKWIVTIVDIISDVYYRGNIIKCSDFIKWQDLNGTILEAPFYVTNTSNTSLGLSQDSYLTLGAERRYIAIQSNADTQKIKKGQRFIFDGDMCWKVNSISKLNNGLINLTLEESQFGANDNVDLRVCDYVKHENIYCI
jgi:hypothetical protein